MIRNYLTIAFRNLMKYKIFSLINLTGLALGMTCSLMILLWIEDERAIDHFHIYENRLYTIYEQQHIDGKIYAGYYTPGVMAAEMKKTLPEIEYATNASLYDSQFTFQAGEKILKEQGGFADVDYFKMFSFSLIEGNKETALNSPLNIAISQKMAVRFFGSAAAAMGKTIRFENKKDLKINAVFEEISTQASTRFDFIINWPTFLDENPWAKEWSNNGPSTFVMLKKGVHADLFAHKIKNFLDNYNKEQNASFRIELGLQRYSEMYLNSNFRDGQIQGGRIAYIKIFSIIAVFILLIACINFMNLTTAKSAKRSKEVGVRKVAGALRMNLIKQFLSEALLITILSACLAVMMTQALLPFFNMLTGKQLIFPWSNINFWIWMTGIILITGFIAGSYPALFLSSFKPISVLKGQAKVSLKTTLFKKGLVVFQFVLSMVLISGTIVVNKHVGYIQTKNLGYDRENLIYIPLEGDLIKSYEVFKQEALSSSGIKQVSLILDSPTGINTGTGGVEWDGKDPNTKPQFAQTGVGYDFVKTMNLHMLEGRDFSQAFPSDSSAYIVNESALKIINYKNPIGKPLTFWGQKGTIIGVIKDFHFSSLHDKIKPIVIRFAEESTGGTILVRTEVGKTRQALDNLERIGKNINPKFPFTYTFSDHEYTKLYKSEQTVNELSKVFAFLAIFISCLGLLGLVMFTTEQRTKEIGIRKVLGANPLSIFKLLTREFLFLVIISLFIASPLAWMALNKWLQDFAYRTTISWWVFALAGTLALLIALATVSFQAIKAALTNPVKSLRSE
jgi:putative ABC transport system permease protein